MADQKSCLIVGCGDIGSRLAKLLLLDGFKVWGVRRNPGLLPEGVAGIAADITTEQSFKNWPQCDYVVYAVAATERSEQGYYSAYVQGLKNLAGWLEKNNQAVQRLFFVSSTRVYHQQQGEWVTEESDTQPIGLGEQLREAESLLDNIGLPSSVVRFAGIYGAGREYLLNQIQAGYGVIEANDPYTNRIHQDDCARMLAYLINQDRLGITLDKCYNGVDNHPAKLSEVVNWLASQLGITLTLPLARSAGSSKRCSNQRLIELGFQFKYPDFKAGYQAMITKEGARP